MHARIKLIGHKQVDIQRTRLNTHVAALRVTGNEQCVEIYILDHDKNSPASFDTAGLEALDLCIKCFLQTKSFAALSDEVATPVFVGKRLITRTPDGKEMAECVVVCVDEETHPNDYSVAVRSVGYGAVHWVRKSELRPLSPPRPKVRAWTCYEAAQNFFLDNKDVDILNRNGQRYKFISMDGVVCWSRDDNLGNGTADSKGLRQHTHSRLTGNKTSPWMTLKNSGLATTNVRRRNLSRYSSQPLTSEVSMGDDVTEWDNPVHVERKCPLCGATRTRFVDVYSDGDEVVECSFGRQKCKGCGLSCKHWDAIDALTAENAELREKVADYVDTVSAMVTAATGTEDIDEQERLLNAAGPKPSCFIAELRKRVEVAEHQRDRALAAFTELKMVSLPPHDVSGTSMWDKATAAVADVRREIGRTAL